MLIYGELGQTLTDMVENQEADFYYNEDESHWIQRDFPIYIKEATY